MWPYDLPRGLDALKNSLANSAVFASALHHAGSHKHCLAREQGKCPGLEYCADCNWREGGSRARD